MRKKQEKRTKAELLAYCKELGIDAGQRLKRDEIIALIEDYETEKRASEKAKAKEKQKAKEKKEEAPRRPKKEDASSDVHFLDGEETPINPEHNKFDIELALSREDQGHVLTGKVGGIYKVDNYKRDDGEQVKYGVLYINYGNRKVYIPSFFFFENWDDPTLFAPDKWYQNLQNRMNSVVDFVVLPSVDGDDRYYATRFPAMRKKRKHYWYAKKKGSDKFHLDEGDISEARVCEAKEAGLVLEIEGAECFMPAKEIGRHYVRSARANYKAGQKVFVRIKNIERSPVPKNPQDEKSFSYPVRFDASIKDAVKDPQVVFFDDYPETSSHMAVVSKRVLDKNGRVRFYCNCGVDPDVVVVYCRLLKGEMLTPEEGDEVKIRIEGSDPETHKIWGVIIHKEEDDKDSLQAFSVLDIPDAETKEANSEA